jgi:hypothetical protein
MKHYLLRYLLPALAAIIIGLAYTSSQSFWIDEGGTIFRAMMPTLREWWRMMLFFKGSDVQMPLYMLYAWFWHQHLGALSEYALRLSNLPWLVLAVVVLARVRFWPLVCLISPFVLYFVDEFRPYTMQIAAGACAAAALGRVLDGRDKGGFDGVHALCAACVFLISTSLTGAVWAAGAAFGTVIMRPDWLRRPGFWLRAAPWMAMALAAASYYGLTMLKGFRATEIPDAGILNVMFGIYEMTGLLGLGPGKDELRGNIPAILPYLWILIPATACIGAALLCGLVSWAQTIPKRHLAAIASAVLLPLLILAVVGVLMEFRVVGRHLSPAIPAILLPIAASLDASGSLRRISLPLGIAACLLLLASSLSIRFVERHAKEDYRKATAMAIEALESGKRVWWQGDMNTPRYYAFRQGGVRMIQRIQVLESDPPTSPMFADIIFINRPDLRFRGQDHHALLKHNYFVLKDKFPGFEVWEGD